MNIDWHARFTQQALWTKSLREYLLKDITLQSDAKILEIGCGTGAILSDINPGQNATLIGLDNNFHHCAIATRNTPNSFVLNADLYSIPYQADSLDLVFCHYLLLWLASPQSAMAEVCRVLKPGGIFLAFAEPDYESRIDYPTEFINLGKLQTQSLVKQGVNSKIGRQLPSLAVQAGFKKCKYGISGYEIISGELPEWWQSEWQTIHYDLSNDLDVYHIEKLKVLDHKSWLDGSRVLWIPTFYLSCEKP